MTFLRDRQLRWYLILQLLLCVFLLAAGILTLNGGTVSGGGSRQAFSLCRFLCCWAGPCSSCTAAAACTSRQRRLSASTWMGDFSSHLPQNQEGDLFQLFSEIEQLSTMLQSKTEAEHKNKEFLKSTISDISHQLKTPLAALMMYQEILESEPENSDTVREFASKMGASLQRMEQLIQSMLKITRLDSGSIVFERRDILVTELIDRAIRDLQTRADQEGKTIQIEGKPEERLLCDPRVDQRGSGKSGEERPGSHGDGGHIRIAWSRTPAMLQIQVSDDGGGIAPEDIHHIFKRFYRSRQSLDSPGIGPGPPSGQVHRGGAGRRDYSSEYVGGGGHLHGFLPYETVSRNSPDVRFLCYPLDKEVLSLWKS